MRSTSERNTRAAAGGWRTFSFLEISSSNSHNTYTTHSLSLLARSFSSFELAPSQLETLKAYLPAQLQSLFRANTPVPAAAATLQDFLPRRVADVVVEYLPQATPEALLAFLVPLLLLLLLSMSSWRSYLGGRYSPFGANPSRSPPQVDGGYHYIDPDDIDQPIDRYDYYSSSRHNARMPEEEDPRAPDILVLKHRGTTYPLHFKPFSIGEGILKVGRLRQMAAQVTGTDDPRRIKLLYKGRQLKDDAAACCEEGLKQNSELMCVIGEAPAAGRMESSSESASEDEILRDERAANVRIDVDGTAVGGKPKRKGHRGGKRKHKPFNRDDHHLGGPETQAAAGNRPRSSSPNPPASTQPPPFDPSLPSTAPPDPSRPRTAMDQIDDLASTFHTQFVPKCVQFLNNPPADAKARSTEYTKLTETILGQIQLKLDGVDTEGRDEVRAKRKALTRELQAMFSRLDAVGKR